MSDAYIGYGLDFQRGDGADPEVFTTVAEVYALSGVGATRNQVDVTHYNSPDGHREFINGLKESNEITISMAFLPDNTTQDQASGILSEFEDGGVTNYKIILPNVAGSEITFAAICTSWNMTADIEDRVTADVSFKPSGKVTVTGTPA